MNTKRSYIVLLVTVLSLGMLLTGGTYAWLLYDTATVSGGDLNANTTCFIMDYSGDFPAPYGDLDFDGILNLIDLQIFADYFDGKYTLSNRQKILADINRDGLIDMDDAQALADMITNDKQVAGEILFPSKTDKGGLSGTVTINIKESCNVSATGNIKLNVVSGTLLSSGALNYSIYDSSNTLIGSGTLSSTGIKTLNTSALTLSKTPTTYTVYVWLDGTKVSNSHLGLSFNGYIYADATQVES